MAIRHATTPTVPSLWPKAFLLVSIIPILTTTASRAYPHGCLYRHPSYYTYDERDDVSWATLPDDEDGDNNGEQLENHVTEALSFTDFRRLPPKSSRLRRPYERYRLTRRLGAGKFSDVFEAVDNQWDDTNNKVEARQKKKKKKKRIRETGEESSSCSEGGGVVKEGKRCGGETTTDAEDEAEEDDVIDRNSLVVLKCLKPVTERKIRRELLVLTHCVTLPNLARVIGIVLPDSMDDDEEDNETEAQSLQQGATLHVNNKKRRRHERLQRENIGSITDATTAARAKNGNGHNKNNKHDGTQLPALVIEHAGQHAQWFCHEQQQQNLQQHDGSVHLSEYEMKYYLCHLIIALDGLHAAGIMHRDVKPRNTLINRFLFDDGDNSGRSSEGVINHSNFDSLQQQSSKQSQPLPPPPLMLVDLGLADFYLPGKEYNVRVASRHYKSPELLIGFEYYDYAIDMWSVGCILAGLLFRREPFFRGKDNEDQLGKIVSVLGTRDFLPYCRKCNVRLSSKARAAIGKYCSRASSSSSSSSSEEAPSLLNNDMGMRKPWLSFLSPSCPIPSPEALDLLDKLLVYDHEQRWTAREALGHSFFDDVREKVLREVQQRITLESQWRPVSMQRR
eukprot:CAMPEP_0172323980 /NCGR_PEP_ID=MMETSP1058-20130122/50067_1 /TAXON_ID=83371 /ORGANISM="Detonula confervacea, Strain CCMP 353" /LENGTH=619 /DNA_ID=CAMNT_0013040125 /DNA_START=427 /DNA_END=2286 /DNA_ORIENTATION=-